MKGRISFHTTLMITIFVICFFFITTIMILSFIQIQKDLTDNYIAQRNNSEEFLKSSSLYISRGLKLWDTTYDDDMRNLVNRLNEEYLKADRNPSRINLLELKNNLDPAIRERTDFYIINESGVIEYTTYGPDYLFNFSPYPEFKDEITKMRLGDSFVSDRIVGGVDPNSTYKKYVYLPTSDHRYLLECSYDVFNLFPEERKALSYNYLINSIVNQNHNVDDIQLFNSFQVTIAGNDNQSGKLAGGDVSQNLTRVFTSKQDLEFPDETNQTITKYVFVNIQEDNAPSSSFMNMVAKIVYSRIKLNDSINYFFIILVILGFSATGMALCMAYLISSRMAEPINNLIKDINYIASGDLNYQIRSAEHPDIVRIARAITRMVEKLRWNMDALQRSESMYRHLFESSYEAIVILQNNRIIECNNLSEIILRTNKQKMLNSSFTSLFHSSSPDIQSVTKIIRKLSEPVIMNKTIEGTFRLNFYYQQDIMMQIKFTPIKIEEDLFIQVLLSDITKEIEMKEHESAALIQIEQNMLQQAVLNDHIRNPLAVITALVDMGNCNQKEEILYQIDRIDQIIKELDKGFYQSDKIRNFLKKHHHIEEKPDKP